MPQKLVEHTRAALWVVEGMLEDKHGCGYTRMVVVSASETAIPDVHLAIRSLHAEGVSWAQVDAIRLLRLVEGRYGPADLRIPDAFELLFDEVKGKAYRRSAGRWKGEACRRGTKRSTPTEETP